MHSMGQTTNIGVCSALKRTFHSNAFCTLIENSWQQTVKGLETLVQKAMKEGKDGKEERKRREK